MRKTIFFALIIKMILLSGVLNAQTYQTLTINGFNHDVIANGVGTANSSTTNDVDGASYCFKAIDWKLNATSAAQTSGFPLNGTITSAATAGLTYQLQSYSANNSIRLVATDNTIVSTVTGVVKAKKLFVLATSGSTASNMECVVTFQDNTTQSFLTNNVPDWYYGTNPPPAYVGFGRLSRATNTAENPSGDPRLYQIALNIAVANQNKEVKSITFTRSATSGGVLNIFAVSAELLGTCPSPEPVTFDAITTATATATLTAPAIIPANGYNYEVRTSGLPGSGATGLVTSGNIPAASTTANLTGLPSSQTLQFYIRSNCSTTDQGAWTGPFLFTMACDVIGAFTENFDTTAVGSSSNPTVPTCWTFIDSGAGYGYVSSSYSTSSPRSFYMYNSSDNSGNYILVSPKTNNLGNGGYRVKFKVRSDWGDYNMIFGRAASNTDATTFTAIGPSITVTPTFTQYVIEIPATTDDYFAFKHGLQGTYRSIYIDDVVFEPIPTCADVLTLDATLQFSALSAVLSWTVPASATNTLFDIEWGIQGFTPGSGTVLTGVTNNYLLEGLTVGQTYAFRVRSNCGTGGVGAWSDIKTFKFDYCSSVPTSNDGSGVTNVTINGTSIPVADVMYYHHTAAPQVELIVGQTATGSVSFATGYTYDTNIWIDLNKNGVFESSELLYQGNSTSANPTTLNVTIPLVGNYAGGIYRMRIGTADSGQVPPNPCYSGSYGVTVDIDVKITPPCLPPDLAATTAITNNSAVINWTASESDPETGYAYEVRTSGAAGSGATGLVSSGTVSATNFAQYVEGLSPSTTYSVYVKTLCNDAELSTWTTAGVFETLCQMTAPIVGATQIICMETPVGDIPVTTASGATIKWYSSLTSTDEITSIAAPGTYYVKTSNAQGCMSNRIAVNVVMVSTSLPAFQAQQYFCNGATVNDLSATPVSGLNIKWYATADATDALASDYVLQNGAIYYVSQATPAGCESSRGQVTAVITGTPAVLSVTQVAMCQPTTFAELQNLGAQTNATIKWYTSLNSLTPIDPSTIVSSGTYFATQTINTCESARTAVNFVSYIGLQKPAAGTQYICGSGSVSDLIATGAVAGAEYHWYTSLTSATPLSSTAALTSGIYYVSQAVLGCESERRSVSVRVIPQTAPVVSPFVICGSGTISNLHIAAASGVSYKWYASASATTELTQNTVLATGTYYVAREEQGCVSQRTPVSVTVFAIPSSPTGSENQSFTVYTMGEATIANLAMDQSGVVWYATYNNARNGINPLSADTPLENGHTYYAVIISANGCPSMPTAVHVDVTLGLDDFDKTNLVYYPNPTADILNIRYKQTIDAVTVYNLVGQKVMTKAFNSDQIQLDMSGFSAGNYLIELHSENQAQIIKVVKK